MKVLHILDSLNRGGTEVLELDVCRNAKANGLDLIFAATGAGDLESDFQRSEVEFVTLKRRAPVDPLVVLQLRKLIKDRGVSLVHTHQAVEALHAYLATRGIGVKNVMSFHLCAANTKNRAALKFLTPRMDANVAVSHDLLNCLGVDANIDTNYNFHVISNGVDAKRLEPTGGNFRAELGLRAEELLLGMIGNFYSDERKDQLTVCRSLPQVFEKAPHARFIFVGGPDLNAPQPFDECVNYCQQQGISERVHFVGKRADLPDILNGLDLFVFSSRLDSFGIAVVEAMMVGVPVVVSNIGALREVTSDGAYASLFQVGDAQDLAQRLIGLIHNTKCRTEVSVQAREWARRQFSIEAHIANLLRLYEGLAGASRSS